MVSKVIHSYNQFHAAGHGTFFSGQLKFGKSSGPSFLWVYDCGSRKPSRINELVKDFVSHAGTDMIDMLCISHFDGDHINGLIALLNQFRVKRLFLPYLPFNKRLEIACELDLDTPGSTDAMLFSLDSAGYLASGNLEGRVDQIVYVRGGQNDGDISPVDMEELPFRPISPEDESEKNQQRLYRFSDKEYPRIFEDWSPVSASVVGHDTPLKVMQGLWEFVFYNKELPDGLAPKSGKSLLEVQEEIKSLIKESELISVKARDLESWQEAFKEKYEYHFGTSAKKKNDISLCLLSRPLTKVDLKTCSLFETPFAELGYSHTLIPVNIKKSGLLFTGDITIKPKQLENMKNHFNSVRWNDIYLMQIPHHGSINSWKLGSAAVCTHDFNIFCVPDYDKAGHHPNAKVLDDLKGKKSVFANYSNSVVYCFHTTPKTSSIGIPGAAVFF